MSPDPAAGAVSPVTGFSHVQLRVHDLAVSLEWYRRALGLEPWVADLTAGYATLRHPGTGVVVVLTAGGGAVGADPGAGALDHLAFAVPDGASLEAWADHLTELGMAHPGVVLEDRRPSLQLRDPDGTAVELVAPAP